MKKISILTATRAEYSLLKPIINRLNEDHFFDVRVVVTGAHLADNFGLTYKEIEADGIYIDKKIDMLLSADSSSAVSKSMGLAMIGFADYFEQLNPDLLIVLGDRYETIAVSLVAMNQKIPIAHLYGGETTEGAIDEAIRHAVTKLSYLHFTSTEIYRRRVIQLGESPERVFNVGALGIENIMSERLMSKSALESALNISLEKPYAIATYHPVTLDVQHSTDQIEALLEACKGHEEMVFIFTKANADAYGHSINQTIEKYTLSSSNIFLFDSLGTVKYLSGLKHAAMVIGNSSSGLIEAPSFGIPTINIGDRQRGRLQASSIISCGSKKGEIEQAITLALSNDFLDKARKTINPYGAGNSSALIVNEIKKMFMSASLNLKKTFYDCEVE